MVRKMVNVSNHPSTNWGEEQISAANSLADEIVDVQFPAVPPEATTEQVKEMANELASDVLRLRPTIVHLMGEQSLTFITTKILLDAGVRVVVSTTERSVVEKDGVKTSVFKFRQFRELPAVERKPRCRNCDEAESVVAGLCDFCVEMRLSDLSKMENLFKEIKESPAAWPEVKKIVEKRTDKW